MEKTRRLKTFSIVALIVAVLGLTIAFAALSKTLTINGTGSVDAANWDIHFKNISEASLTGKATTTGTPSLEDNGATINDMKVSLKEPGDKVVYTVDVENSGDINAEIDSILLPTFTTAQSNILDFKAVYTSNNKEISQGDILESKETKNVTITIMYKDITDESLLPKEGISVNLKYELHFVQTDKASGSSSQGSGSQVLKTYNVGDKFCLNGESECFYTISDNGDTVTALAEWNLNVGDNKNTAVTEGLQDESIKGMDESGEQGYGTIAFSDTNYWEYDAIYDTDYPTFIYEDFSLLYEYMQAYQTYLRNDLGKTSVSATLLSHEQAVNLGCDLDKEYCSSAPAWVYQTSYWLGSARNYGSVLSIDEIGIFTGDDDNFYHDDVFGLRPVITISKSEL